MKTAAEYALVELGANWQGLHRQVMERTDLGRNAARDLLWAADCDVDTAVRWWRERNHQ